MPAPDFSFKRGDTPSYIIDWSPGTAGPADLTGLTVTAALKTRSGARHALAVSVDGGLLFFTVTITGSDAWDLGPCALDAKLVNGAGAVVHSQTFTGVILEAIAR